MDRAAKASREIMFSIDSRLEEVSLVGLAVRGICAGLPLSRTEASQMEVCVVEVVTNAIKHAYRLEPGHAVQIAIRVYPDRIGFAVANRGEPVKTGRGAGMDFDPRDVQGLPEGGMGLHIVKRLMDELSYRHADGVSTFRMVKRFRKGSSTV